MVTPAAMPLDAKVETVSAVAPATAKFTPCVKLPSLFRYGSRKGRFKAWAVITYSEYMGVRILKRERRKTDYTYIHCIHQIRTTGK